MARYPALFTLGIKIGDLHASLKKLFESCDLNMIYDTPEYVMAGEGSIPRLPMFESMGISEVWRYRSQVIEGAVQGELEIWQLTSAGYRLTEMSLAFPELSVIRIQAFIAESDTLGLSKALTLLRSEFAR